MNGNELYKIAGQLCEEAYKNRTDLGTTEYLARVVAYKGMAVQMLAIPGTDELSDWFKNLNMLSINGIKIAAAKAADEIYANFKPMKGIPVYVTGHSKGGATAIAYKKKYGADYCIAFCPARSLRYWIDRRMNNTTIFIDRDDPVPKAGLFSFGHPICTRIMLPKDHIISSVSDHMMTHINKFLNSNPPSCWCNVN